MSINIDFDFSLNETAFITELKSKGRVIALSSNCAICK